MTDECEAWQHAAIRWGLDDLTGRCIKCKELIGEDRSGIVLRQTLGHGRDDFYASVAFIVCEDCFEGKESTNALIERIATFGHRIYTGASRGVGVEK